MTTTSPRQALVLVRNPLKGISVMARLPRTWLITGSNRGLGRSLHAALLLGDNVVATARDTAWFATFVAQQGDRMLPVTVAS